MITQERIDELNARLTPADVRAIASDWQAVGDDLRSAMDGEDLVLSEAGNRMAVEMLQRGKPDWLKRLLRGSGE